MRKMPPVVLWLLIGAALSFPALGSAFDLERAQLERLAEKAALVREMAAQALPSHPWAGVYGHSLAFGGSLSITPEGRYAETVSGCFGLIEARFGRVDAEGDEITLVADDGRTSQRLTVIRWGDQRFLVDKVSAADFANSINAYGLPTPDDPNAIPIRGGLQRSDPAVAIPPAGTPLEMPEEFRALLRPQAVEARIIEIISDPDRLGWDEFDNAQLAVKLDRGKLDGVFPQMSLYGQRVFCDVESVQDNDAICMVEVSRFDASERPELPMLGTLLSSRFDQFDNCEDDSRATIVANLTTLDESFDELAWNNNHYAILHGRVDSGRADGLQIGMLMVPVDDSRRGVAKIVSTTEHSSLLKLRIQRYWDDEVIGADERPRVGMQWQTIGGP